MQLANQSGEPDQKMSPSIYAALINSLFQNPGPMFAGVALRRRRRGHDGAEDRQRLLWPCVALLIVDRRASARSTCVSIRTAQFRA